MGDKFDKFKSPENTKESPVLLDDSVLYLSSNWSARMSIKTNHELAMRDIPTLDIQKVLDLPDSDEDEVEVEIVPDKTLPVVTDDENPFVKGNDE